MIDRLALVIGTMKAGTTALFRYLEQHPKLATSRDKETNWFCRPEVRERGEDWYRGQFGFDPKKHAWALEASPNYTRFPDFEGPPTTALDFQGELRFIYLVRNPFARLRSHMQHALAAGWREDTFEDGVPEKMFEVCDYQTQIQRYVDAFGKGPILVLRHEDLVADPKKLVRRVCKFLGVSRLVRFQNPGRQNAGNDYKRVLLCRALAEDGLIPALDGDADEHYRQYAEGAPEDAVRAAEAAIKRWITPTAAQEAQVRERLTPGYEQFARDWGVDPWGR